MKRPASLPYGHTSQPFAVVTAFGDGSGLSVNTFADTVRARMYVENEQRAHPGRHAPHEYRIVRLPELRAWIVANEVRP